MIKDALSYLSPDLEIEGSITCSGPIRIDAQIRGKIDSKQQVNVGTPALIQGPIQAETVVVNGTVQGDLHISDKVAVLSQAKIQGNVHVPKGGLSVVKGSRIEGTLNIGTPKIPKIMQQSDV